MARKNGGLRIEVSKYPNRVVCLDVHGTIDAHTAPKLERKITNLFNSKMFKIIINLNDVSYMASAGASVFLDSIQEAQTNSGDIALVNPSDAVNELFLLLGINTLFKVFNDISEAVAYFEDI